MFHKGRCLSPAKAGVLLRGLQPPQGAPSSRDRPRRRLVSVPLSRYPVPVALSESSIRVALFGLHYPSRLVIILDLGPYLLIRALSESLPSRPRFPPSQGLATLLSEGCRRLRVGREARTDDSDRRLPHRLSESLVNPSGPSIRVASLSESLYIRVA